LIFFEGTAKKQHAIGNSNRRCLLSNLRFALRSLLLLSEGEIVYVKLPKAATPALQWPLRLVSVIAWKSVLSLPTFICYETKTGQMKEGRQN